MGRDYHELVPEQQAIRRESCVLGHHLRSLYSGPHQPVETEISHPLLHKAEGTKSLSSFPSLQTDNIASPPSTTNAARSLPLLLQVV